MEQSSERDQSNRVLLSVSEDVAYLDWPHMQMPSTYDLTFVSLLIFVLCLIFVSSLFFLFQFPVLFYFVSSCSISNVLVLHVLLFLCIALTYYVCLY